MDDGVQEETEENKAAYAGRLSEEHRVANDVLALKVGRVEKTRARDVGAVVPEKVKHGGHAHCGRG